MLLFRLFDFFFNVILSNSNELLSIDRSSKKHNFDFYLRSRTAAELQKRATTLLMEINREYLENMAKNTSASSDISASTNGDTVRMSQDKMEMDMDMTIV